MLSLAERASAELNVDVPAMWNATRDDAPSMQTTMRLITEKDALQARVDELEAAPARRSEPMPEPVPVFIKRIVCRELVKDNVYSTDQGLAEVLDWEPGRMLHCYARLIWERGDREPVDPLLIEARKLLAMEAPDTAYERRCLQGVHDGCTEFKIITLALRRGMELAKEQQ
jgi:hypothetical protein